MDAIDLAALDDAPHAELDPLVWSANLKTLQVEQPELASQIEEARLPPHWRAAAALDGFQTFRIEASGQPPHWLAETAAPLTRARALLRFDQIGDRNPALPTVAAGAELRLLLERLAPQQAVFVFAEQMTDFAAVLRTVDLAQGIANGRCVLVPPDREETFLKGLLERHAGLLPPQTIVPLPGITDERLVQLRQVCESLARRIGQAREERLRALGARNSLNDQRARQRSGEPRLAVLALGPGRLTHRLSEELAASGEQLGWAVHRCAMTGPRQAHALPHCEQLAEFAAGLSICVGHPPTALPLRSADTVCQWHVHAKDVPEQLPVDDTIHLAATPRVAQALEAAGVPAPRLVEFYWGYPARKVPAAAGPPTARTVVILVDLPDASAGACHIEQPTHRKLWTQLHQTASQTWETAAIRQPTALLRAAERASGVELTERPLRQRMLRIIEHVLIPAVVLERILQALERESFGIITVGAGWQRCSSECVQAIASSLEDGLQRAATIAPTAAIFAGPLDPLSPGLFDAASPGWPLLIHCPGGVSLSTELGGLLHAQQHYDAFAGARDLLAALHAIAAHPEQTERRCTRVRAYLQQHHTYTRRLMTLVQRLGLEWPDVAG
jgi:hypothetical protein